MKKGMVNNIRFLHCAESASIRVSVDTLVI